MVVGLPAFYMHPTNKTKRDEILNYRKKIFDNRKKNADARTAWRSQNLCEEAGRDAKEELMEYIRTLAAEKRLSVAQVFKGVPHTAELEVIIAELAENKKYGGGRASSKKKKKRRKSNKAQKKKASKKASKKAQKTRRRRPSNMVTGEKRHVYLEYTKGTSNKFWEAELSKKKDRVFLSWGRIGGATQSKTQHLGRSTPSDNILAFNKLVQSKLKKGYVRGGVDTRPPATR